MEVTIPTNLHITTMSRYNSEFPFAVAFPPQAMTNVLAEWLAAQGSTQAHIAETEKYAHVTFFFNAVSRRSSRTRSGIWSLRPPKAVADTVAKVVESNKHDFVMCNFALPDMPRTPQVGHKGNYDSAVKAIPPPTPPWARSTPRARARVRPPHDGDHGNAEQLLNAETGARTRRTRAIRCRLYLRRRRRVRGSMG
ncbi:hypothetical protein B0H13DRAFT_2380877 [Mycena leptocephala]|nr:hypothetical protein B0H13DRAFT_2380877 [Mycena leptocephala]